MHPIIRKYWEDLGYKITEQKYNEQIAWFYSNKPPFNLAFKSNKTNITKYIIFGREYISEAEALQLLKLKSFL